MHSSENASPPNFCLANYRACFILRVDSLSPYGRILKASGIRANDVFADLR